MKRYGNDWGRRFAGWLKRQFHRRPKPIWMVIAADILLIGLSLVIFALFHHALPRRGVSVGLISSRAAAADSQGYIGDTADESDAGGEAASLNLAGLTADGVAFSDDASVEEGDGADPQGADPEPADSGPAEATPVEATAAPMLVGNLAADVSGYFGDKFADLFTDGKVVKSSSGYRSKNVNITLKRFTSDETVFYVADIYLRDISSLVTAFAEDTYGRGIREWATTISRNLGAVIAINGDFYGGRSDGIVIRNGELYREEKYPDRDICVLNWDGTMETYAAGKFDAEAAINAGAYQVWNFGPRLLDQDGKAKTRFNSNVGRPNPRTALGYYEPGHYCFVVVDGRQEDSDGMELRELAALMQQLGCVRAYNMDGGNTSVMVVGDTVVNHPSNGGRPTTDIIAIVDN